MRQTLEWQLKKGHQAVVLETSDKFSLDFTGHSTKHSPNPDIFILQPAVVPVQKRQECSPEMMCNMEENLYRLKAGLKLHQNQSEAFQWSQQSGIQLSVPKLTTLLSAANLGKCYWAQSRPDPTLHLFEHRGILLSPWHKSVCPFSPSLILYPGERRAEEHEPAFQQSSCLGSASSSCDNREALLLCFLLVPAMTSASQLCLCSDNMTHNKAIIISTVTFYPWPEPKSVLANGSPASCLIWNHCAFAPGA